MEGRPGHPSGDSRPEGRFYRDLTGGSSRSGKSSMERRASEKSRFPNLQGGARDGWGRIWPRPGGSPAPPTPHALTPLPSDQVEVVAQRGVVAVQLIWRGVFSRSLGFGGVGVDQLPQADEQGQ